MKARLLLVCLSLAVIAAGASSGLAQRGAPEERKPVKLVTLDLKDVPLADAVRQILAATDLSVVFVGDLPREPKVTMRLKEADPIPTLEMLANFAGFQFSPYRHPEVGAPVAVLAPLRELTYPPVHGGIVTGGGGGGGGGRADLAPPSLPDEITSLVVDLDMKDAPFREAIAAVDKQVHAVARTSLLVDDSVPQDLRVTARLHKMPLSWVLTSLVQQAGLTYGIQDTPAPEVVARVEGMLKAGMINELSATQQLTSGSRSYTIYIVPRPELRVSNGPGTSQAQPK